MRLPIGLQVVTRVSCGPFRVGRQPASGGRRAGTWVLWILAVSIAACRFTAAQDGEAPAIAQGGIANLASRIPVQQPMGGAAPGSLISIRGFRLGPAVPDAVQIRIRRGAARVEAPAVSVNENEIEVIVPEGAPRGTALLQVVRNGHASLEWPIEIVESSFGAFSRNRQGWGTGEISNSDGNANSEAQPAKPGEAVTIAGTGLGVRGPRRALPQVLVAGHLATGVLLLKKTEGRPGVDSITFNLPGDTPEGCHVPVQVSSAPGLYSNSVTMAISQDGSPCTDRFDWASRFRNQKLRLATVGLVHADIDMSTTEKQPSVYATDAGFVTFSEIERNAPVNFLFLFPPTGTCTTYSGTAKVQAIPFALLEPLPGKPLDAGQSIIIRGPGGGTQMLPSNPSSDPRYWLMLGGELPVDGSPALPLFLKPGDYEISAPGGSEVGAFLTTVHAGPPVIWQNRRQLREVDRRRGTTVTWLSPETPAAKLILILAMNQDSRSGTLSLCACLAPASSGSFHIPPCALANIPPTRSEPRGLPLSLVLILELPSVPAATAAGAGIDSVVAFGASISARLVQFK